MILEERKEIASKVGEKCSSQAQKYHIYLFIIFLGFFSFKIATIHKCLENFKSDMYKKWWGICKLRKEM